MSTEKEKREAWLVRVPEVWAGEWERLHGGRAKKLGREYRWVEGEAEDEDSEVPWVRWRMPVHHAWPCRPREMDGFIEKAAQGLKKKFGGVPVQTLLVGVLDAGSPQKVYRHLASNLRGRALQVMELAEAAEAEEQDPEKPTLYVLLGQEGVYAGVIPPREAGGFYPGGSRFVKQEGAISRAGAKVAEALHLWRLRRPLPGPGALWLELGASPGGMTSELLDRGYEVMAVDRAPLDPRLEGREGLEFYHGDVKLFSPTVEVDALLCDLNGPPMEALGQVRRLASRVKAGGLVFFTLKGAGVEGEESWEELFRWVEKGLEGSGLRKVAVVHLTYNRREFTWFLERERD